MKSSSEESGALIAANLVAFDDNTKHVTKKQKRNNILLIIGLLVAFGALIYIYFQWQKVPTKKHFIRAEYIASADSSKRMRAEFILTNLKALDLKKKEYLQLPNYDLFNVTDVFKDSSFAVPLHKYKYDKLNFYVGDYVDSAFREYCNNNIIQANRYSDIFLFRHLDNEKYSDIISTDMAPINHANKQDLDHFLFYENNCFVLSDSIREDSLGFNLSGFEKKPLSVNELLERVNPPYLDFSTNGFNNIFTSIILAPKKNQSFSFQSQIHKKHESRVLQFLKMEDISQAKYSIKLRSQSIPELKLKLYYGGLIECAYTHKPSIDWDINRDPFINTGDNFVEILRKQGYGDLSLEFRVQYIDMQNAQRIRLFLLTALLTFIFTTLIKLLWITVTGFTSKNQKKNRNNSKEASDRKIYFSIHEKENDIPINTPDYYINPPGID